jgi:hypothetical protein
MQIKSYIQRINIELFIWPAALVLLYFMDPHTTHAFSLCPLKYLGVTWCPGCGLGHSISFLMHGEWKASFHSHPLGAFAIIILIYRTLQLGLQSFTELKQSHT